jgi:hypothetical protein
MISDGTNGNASNNAWEALSTATITVPIGISNVTDVQTLMGNLWGLAGANSTDITFNFGTSSNASSFNDVVTVDLTNAGISGSSPSGQIGTFVDCTTAGSSSCNTTYAVGPLAGTSTPTTVFNSVTQPTGVTVTTGNLASNLFGASNGNSYNSANGSIFLGTSGNVSVDDQDFLLGSLVTPSASEYLVSIQVTEEVGGTSSRTALSAITVNTTPEPSTILLFLSGFGALGLARLRRR